MLTYPYMHDGTVASVEDAIRIMHEFQIGKEINDVEVEKSLFSKDFERRI